MKKIYFALTLICCTVLLQSGINSSNYSSVPPTGYTGATGNYCTSCHSDFALNTAGGSVSIAGLPSGGYIPNTAYPLQISISHGSANRKKWGFSIKAVNSSGTSIGSFSSTNANAAVNGSELSHNNAVTTVSSSSYTYTNLKWTAPASAVGNVTFYYVGNAASGAGDGSSGDYIYAGSSVLSLPIELSSFNASTTNNETILKWQTVTEINSNYFEVQRSDDGQFFFTIGKIDAIGNSNKSTNYSFIDKKLSNNSGSLIFYRLKLVDKDGSERLSNSISIKPVISGVTIKNLYPTIIRKNDQINVDIISDKTQKIDITILDELGRNLQQFSNNLVQGYNSVKLTPNFQNAKNVIFIKFSLKDFQQTKTLILQ